LPPGPGDFYVESATFRHRELFEQPIDEARLFPPTSPDRATSLPAEFRQFRNLRAPGEPQGKRLKTIDGPVVREIVYRDWAVRGQPAIKRRSR